MANSKALELARRINANATQAKKELGSTEKALEGLKDQAKQA